MADATETRAFAPLHGRCHFDSRGRRGRDSVECGRSHQVDVIRETTRSASALRSNTMCVGHTGVRTFPPKPASLTIRGYRVFRPQTRRITWGYTPLSCAAWCRCGGSHYLIVSPHIQLHYLIVSPHIKLHYLIVSPHIKLELSKARRWLACVVLRLCRQTAYDNHVKDLQG
jgi:hypothetical protein